MTILQKTHHSLDRHSALPLYHQLFIDLRRRLLSGEWKSGDPFPKDSEIEAAYDVSRITVRQAVSQLVDSNFVVRYRGKGSFVGNLSREGARVNHHSVAAEISELGGAPTHKFLSLERHEVSEVTAHQLEMPVGGEVSILKRLYLMDGEPFCHEAIMVSTVRFPDVFTNVFANCERLADAYRRLGIDVVKSDQMVNAIMLSGEVHQRLNLPPEAPALFVERVGFSAANEPLEVRRLYYRTDNHTLRQEIIWGSADNRIV